MPKKVYIIENLDCANCAAKIEAKLNALPEVEEATITFATRQLRLTAEDPDALVPRLTQIARTVESEVTIIPRDQGHHQEHEHHEGCDCDHHHDHGHHEGCNCGHHHDHGPHGHDHHGHDHDGEEDPKPIILGAALFAGGIFLNYVNLGWTAALIFVGAYLILGVDVLKTAWKNLTKGHVFDENFLMSIATIGAFLIGEFPEAVGVMLFYRVGEFFEQRAVSRSRSQIMEAVDLRPETVNRTHGEAVETVPADLVHVGDLLLVRPGDRIPLDGTVISGESRIDTAPITGEPVPVSVCPGSNLTSGCINLSGQLTLRVEKPLKDSMVSRILDSVENAAASKPKIDRFITRFARIYTPVVVALAAATAVIPSLFTGDWGYWVYTALSFLVMSCPCALVLSVPLAFFSGIGVGSRQGILFKGGLSIEALAGVKAVAMDKTGTLTKGDFSVQSTTLSDEALALCAGCEQHSTHPIAISITAYAKERRLSVSVPDSLEELAGMGIRGVAGGKTVLCGNEKLMAHFGIDTSAFRAEPALTCVLVAVDGRYEGCILISDTLKNGAAEAVGALHGMGIATAMLTGDSAESAAAVAKSVGISALYAKLLPQEKLTALQSIRSTHGATMFVGDGINDAPVLAGADVGAAMGTGADAAMEAADVVFMTSDPQAIPQALRIARQTQTVAWQNVVFALAVKFLVMALGLLGYANMWMAVFADSGVAMLCVINSVRMLYRNR